MYRLALSSSLIVVALHAGCDWTMGSEPAHPRAAVAQPPPPPPAPPPPPPRPPAIKPPPPLPSELASLGVGSVQFASTPLADAARVPRTRVVAGDPIYAIVATPVPLATHMTSVWLRFAVDWIPTGTAPPRACGHSDASQFATTAAYGGTTYGGTTDGIGRRGQALADTRFDVGIVPTADTAPDFDVGCTEDLRRESKRPDAGIAYLRFRLIATSGTREATLVDGTLEVDFSDHAATAARFAQLDAIAVAREHVRATKRHLPPTRMPSLEHSALAAARKAVAAKFAGDVPIHVVILDDDFRLDRNERSSVVIQRYVSSKIVVRKPDNTCGFIDAQLREAFDGVAYQSLQAGLGDFVTEIACANVAP